MLFTVIKVSFLRLISIETIIFFFMQNKATGCKLLHAGTSFCILACFGNLMIAHTRSAASFRWTASARHLIPLPGFEPINLRTEGLYTQPKTLWGVSQNYVCFTIARFFHRFLFFFQMLSSATTFIVIIIQVQPQMKGAKCSG